MFMFKLDYGVPIDLDVTSKDCQPKDLTDMTTVQFEFEKPDGTIVVKTAAKVNPPGVDGKLRYMVEQNFLDVVGTWSYRGLLSNVSSQFRTEKLEFSVRS